MKLITKYLTKFYLMKKLVLFMFCAFFAFACSNDDNFTADAPDTDEVFDRQVKYKGESYLVQYKMVNDSLIYMNNEDFINLYENEISNSPTMAVCVLEDGTIEYYNSYEELASNYEIEFSQETEEAGNESILKATLNDGMAAVTFWDDTNYKDRSFTFVTSPGPLYSVSYHQLKNSPYKFNDKCSAFKLQYNGPSNYRAVLVMYEHDNYRGKTLTFIATSSQRNINIPSLKPYGFNDKMTSFGLNVNLFG